MPTMMPTRRTAAVENASDSAGDLSKRTPTNTLESKKFVVVIIAIIAVLAVVGCVWMFVKYSSAKKQINALTTPQGQQEMAKKEVKALLDKVSKLIVLPSDEEPTVATITDADSLKKEQQFYRDAQNGNKVIIYMQAKKAIIYDEGKDILVNVGPIFVNEETTSTPPVTEADND